MTASHIEVYSLPFDDRGNRYFALWRDALERTGRVQAKPVPRGGLLRLACLSSGGCDRLLIIHWSTVLYGSRFLPKSLVQLAMNTVALLVLKARGWTIFWVMHNAAAHDYPHLWIDSLGRTLIRSCADAVIVHQRSTQQAFARDYAHPQAVYIPHGHYQAVYGERPADREGARARCGFGPKDLVFLALGMIRPYKRLEQIIDAFDRTSCYPSGHARLWIVGKGDPGYVGSLQARSDSAGIRIENRFIPDDELPEVLAASDYSVFFYDDSELTSGGIILSLSYGVPIVSRPIPAAEMAREGQSSFFFDSVEGLSTLVERLAETVPPSPEQVFGSADLVDWDAVAHSYVTLYDSLYAQDVRS